MTFVSPRVLPPGLPAWLAPAHRHVCGWVERLPAAPPSFLLAQLLDRLLWTRLPVDVRAALAGRCIELRVSDFGLRLRLMRGEEDPDRLFFERALVMEGDTELGLVIKNTLDAIGPLWPGWVPFGPAR